jgi:hypothetical protein
MKKSFLVFGALGAFFAGINFAAASSGIDITCPESCTLECVSSNNGIHCECKGNDGTMCSEIVNTTSIFRPGEETPTQNTDVVNATAIDKTNTIQKMQKKAVSARAAKVGSRVVSEETDTPAVPDDIEDILEMASGSSYNLRCPSECKLKCWKTNHGSAMTCECVGRGNRPCVIKGEPVQDEHMDLK